MSFLSGRLSSTARTWNGVSVATAAAAMADRNKRAELQEARVEERLEEVCVLGLVGMRGFSFAVLSE